VFSTLFWIFLVVGLAIAVLGFTGVYGRADDKNNQNGRD
jgi:hypothetical protein